MELEKPKCADCKFYQEFSNGVGHCKRYPPTVYACDEDNSTNTAFPMIKSDDWCGEHDPIKGWIVKDGYVAAFPSQKTRGIVHVCSD